MANLNHSSADMFTFLYIHEECHAIIHTTVSLVTIAKSLGLFPNMYIIKVVESEVIDV